MLKAVYEAYPIIKETFDRASKIVGFDCWELAQKGPEQTLNQTAYTQPVLLAADVALWELLKIQFPNIQPAMMAGHSLGEYAALVAANAIRFEDAIYVVHQRGQFMQEAIPPSEGMGSMAAILGLENSVIETICKEVTKGAHLVSAANYNAIGQTVIAGNPAAVLEATEKMKQQGAKRAIVLPVSVPSHCALMQSAAEKLAKVLESI
jgi:[acyl-carrier-protein] S-malonyltransferase